MAVTLKLYEAAMIRLLSGPNGEVARDLLKRGKRVESAAKVIATGAPKVQTGRYRASIASRLGADGRSLYVEVGSNVDYALILDEGSPPHEIRPRTKKALFWRGARHPVKVVRHPGTRAYRVLQKALLAAK